MSESPEDLVARAERLYIEAALMLTRLDAKMRRAVLLVLAGDRNGEKLSVAAAARRVGRHRNNVYRALAKARPKIELVKRESQHEKD